jgi:hypothetical protein
MNEPAGDAAAARPATRLTLGDAAAVAGTRHVLWSTWEPGGFEHLCLWTDGELLVADGVLARAGAEGAYRLRYRIRCDSAFLVRDVSLTIRDHAEHHLELYGDGLGHWSTPGGRARREVSGCLDLELAGSPFTPTLALRRLGLHAGQSAEVAVATIALPALSLHQQCVRYTCEREGAAGGVYRREGASAEGVRDLRCDADGITLDVAGLFRRIWPR